MVEAVVVVVITVVEVVVTVVANVEVTVVTARSAEVEDNVEVVAVMVSLSELTRRTRDLKTKLVVAVAVVTAVVAAVTVQPVAEAIAGSTLIRKDGTNTLMTKTQIALLSSKTATRSYLKRSSPSAALSRWVAAKTTLIRGRGRTRTLVQPASTLTVMMIARSEVRRK